MAGKTIVKLEGQINKFDYEYSSGLIPICLGFDGCLSGENLLLTIDAALKKLKLVYIVLIDSPQIITKRIQHPDKTDEELLQLISQFKKNWLKDFASLSSELKERVIIISWKQSIADNLFDFLKGNKLSHSMDVSDLSFNYTQDSYNKQELFFTDLYKNDQDFIKAIKRTIGKFLRHNKLTDAKEGDELDLNCPAAHLSIEYRIKECASFMVWSETISPNIILSKHELSKDLAYMLDKYIAPQNPTIMQPVEIKLIEEKKKKEIFTVTSDRKDTSDMHPSLTTKLFNSGLKVNTVAVNPSFESEKVQPTAQEISTFYSSNSSEAFFSHAKTHLYNASSSTTQFLFKKSLSSSSLKPKLAPSFDETEGKQQINEQLSELLLTYSQLINKLNYVHLTNSAEINNLIKQIKALILVLNGFKDSLNYSVPFLPNKPDNTQQKPDNIGSRFNCNPQ